VVATQDVDLETIRKDLRSKIAVYKIPRALRVYDAIPRNAMGKIAKKVSTSMAKWVACSSLLIAYLPFVDTG
jgi:acyl-coenzyme A synthetase/AMP-(fatty) acid ligase